MAEKQKTGSPAESFTPGEIERFNEYIKTMRSLSGWTSKDWATHIFAVMAGGFLVFGLVSYLNLIAMVAQIQAALP